MLRATDACPFLGGGPTVTGPVSRFARQIAGHGYIVAAPSSYHEFTGPEPLAYDGPGTDEGNDYKIKKVRRLAQTPSHSPYPVQLMLRYMYVMP